MPPWRRDERASACTFMPGPAPYLETGFREFITEDGGVEKLLDSTQ